LLLCQIDNQQIAISTAIQQNNHGFSRKLSLLHCCCLHLHIATGVPQRELLMERAELLYGQAKFKPLQQTVAAAGKAAAVVALPAGAASP
jgi:hypothetical protein